MLYLVDLFLLQKQLFITSKQIIQIKWSLTKELFCKLLFKHPPSIHILRSTNTHSTCVKLHLSLCYGNFACLLPANEISQFQMHCPWGYQVMQWNNEGFLLLQWRSAYSGPLLLSHFSGWSEQWGDKREASAFVWCKIIKLYVQSLPGAALQLLKQILACPQWH